MLSLAISAPQSACGGDDAASVDAATSTDSGATLDAPALGDARAQGDAMRSGDGGTAGEDARALPDASLLPDASPLPDASLLPDANLGPCNALAFGEPAVTLEQVTTLPTMTGGTIPQGVYDAVAFKMITTITTGTLRATWSFETGTVLQTLQQIALNGNTPPAPTPRTASYTALGTDLTQVRTCAGDTTLSSQYTVRSDAGGTFLDVRENTVMFTFKRRP